MTIRDAAWLIGILIVLAYFAGASSILKVFFAGVQNIIPQLQGRLTSGPNAGQFAAYPKAA